MLKSCSASERQNGSSGRMLRNSLSSAVHTCVVQMYNIYRKLLSLLKLNLFVML